MKNSVLVVTYNRLEWLKKCLKSIYEQTQPFNNIYIVNNCSTDKTLEYLEKEKKERKNLIVINSEKNLGGTGGFYLGLKKFIENSDIEEWISIMDDDCILDKDFNKNILKDDSDIKNSYTPFRYIYETKKLDLGFLKDLKKINEIEYTKVTFPFNGFTINKELIKKIGLPNKEYFIYEDDYEYCCRIIKYGGDNRAIKLAKIYHPGKAEKNIKINMLYFSEYQLSRLAIYYGTRNRIINKKKYKDIIKLSLMKLLYREIKQVIKYLLVLKFELSILKIKGIIDGIRGKEINKGKI